MDTDDINKGSVSKQDIFDIEVDEIFPIRIFNESNDAVRELVLETCDTTARTPISEINILNNEDMLALEKKYDNLKSDIKKASDYLQKAYDNTMYFADYVNKEIEEVKRGGKSISDMEEDLKYKEITELIEQKENQWLEIQMIKEDLENNSVAPIYSKISKAKSYIA